ncbi:hypothetical protein OESDEN_17610 [Oesophagostomum dentatum]|nr:hypothetical protein OESDEN_17610 [Oesophagostomum dentatum]
MVEVFVKALIECFDYACKDFRTVIFTCTVPAHSEDEHDAEEFRKEFGDEPQGESFSQGTEDDHVELREGSQFSNVKPKILSGRKLPTLRFLYW